MYTLFLSNLVLSKSIIYVNRAGMQLNLKPKTTNLQFLTFQFIQIIGPDGSNRQINNLMFLK